MSLSEITFKIIPQNQITCIIPFLRILDDSIDEDTLAERLVQMEKNDYQCVGIYDGDKLIGMSGLWILRKYYVGKHLELDNVCISPEYRDQGIGQKLQQWIEVYAKEQGCQSIELNCYIKNEAGRKFWEREGYTALGIHYQKKIVES